MIQTSLRKFQYLHFNFMYPQQYYSRLQSSIHQYGAFIKIFIQNKLIFADIMKSGVRKQGLKTQNDYKQLIIYITNAPLPNESINAVHDIVRKLSENEIGCRKIHQEYLPDCIEALRKKFCELSREKQKNNQINIFLRDLLKLFKQYQQKLNVKLRGEIPEVTIQPDEVSDLEIIDNRVRGIAFKQVSSPDPRNLSYLQSVYEGKLNVQNLEHDFISVLRVESRDSYINAENVERFTSRQRQQNVIENQKVQKSVGRQSLENAICAALNYRRKVVIVLGTNQHLEVVGIPLTQDLRTQYEDKLQRIMKQSIKPQFLLSDLRIKLVPVLTRKGLEQTGNCLITIEVTKRTKGSCFIQLQRKGYHTMYLFYIAQKQSKSLRQTAKQQQEKAYLKVEEPKGQQIYHAMRNNHLSSAKINTNRNIHYFEKECKEARPFNATEIENYSAKFIEIQQFGTQHLLNILKGHQTYTNFTYIKFQSQKKQFQHEYQEIIYNIYLELQKQREAYSIKKLKWSQTSEDKKGKYEKTVFFVIIMHDYHPQMVKNTIISFNKGMNFEFGSVKLIHKLYDMKSNNQLDELKKKDGQLMLQFNTQFDEDVIERFYTIGSQNTIKVYYKIKSECKFPRVASLMLFIINLRLGKSRKFTDEQKIIRQKHPFPINYP